jgi:hypothetical protein
MAFDGMEGVDLVKWTQVIVGALLGAFVAVFFRRPHGWLDWVALFGSSFCIGVLSAQWVSGWLDLQLYEAAGLSGGFGFAVYQGVRKAIEAFDFGRMLPGGKGET